MRESELERILADEVRKVGGRAYKWVSPGNDGVPDRIVFMPGGKIYLLELKTKTKKPRPIQEVQISRLRKLGQIVMVLRGMQGLIDFFKVAGLVKVAEKYEKKYAEGGEAR